MLAKQMLIISFLEQAKTDVLKPGLIVNLINN